MILKAEFKFICQKIITDDNYSVKDKKKKLRKKTITILTGLLKDNESVDINMQSTLKKKGTKPEAMFDIIEDVVEVV